MRKIILTFSFFILFSFCMFFFNNGRIYFFPLEVAKLKTCNSVYTGSLFFKSYKPLSKNPPIFIKVRSPQGDVLLERYFFDEYAASDLIPTIFCKGNELVWHYPEEGFYSTNFITKQKIWLKEENEESLTSQGFEKVSLSFKNGFKQTGWFIR